MEKNYRDLFLENFTATKYHTFQETLTGKFGEACTFRVAESPVFISPEFKGKLLRAADEILEQLMTEKFKAHAEKVFDFDIPCVPNESAHPELLQFDFGVCEDENGELTPKLIELQGFPSLYFFQQGLAEAYKEAYGLDERLTHLFHNNTKETYYQQLKDVIVSHHKPENVILIDIDPGSQNTRIDFWGTRKALGIPVLDLRDVKVSGRDLYYINEKGKKVEIHRIYNRVIFDELLGRDDIQTEFDFTQAINAEWAGHPNWFVKISKHSMPLLSGDFVPETTILSDLKTIPTDLENYVLKPLFSFSGSGVIFDVTKEDVEKVDQPDRFVLQRKETYVPFIRTDNPAEGSKAEIRLMFLWPLGQERPSLVCNLMRMSKGQMIGVKYNKDKSWVGASVGLFL